MKRIILTLALGLGLLTANAQIEKLSGPRLGMNFDWCRTSSRFFT